MDKLTENELAYWRKRDQIIDADIIWLAQRHVTNAIESLTERGYDQNSYAVRELQSIVDRLSKLAATVQTGLDEETEAEHQIDVSCIINAGCP